MGVSTPAPKAQVVDDYLKTIYQHTEWQSQLITPSHLAKLLGLAPSTVTEMVRKLAANGLVSHRPYGPLALTGLGERRAAAVIRRHRLIETWLVREYGYSWDEVHDEAEVLEHTLSDRLLARIDERLGHPRVDPHGDAIPDADGRVERGGFVLLADSEPGHEGEILRVSDRDPALLRGLDALGVRLGAKVARGSSPLTLMQGGQPIQLPADADTAIWLSAPQREA